MASASRELLTSRLLPFPPAVVYDAFADPRRLARWWGPNGATNSFREFDLRAGGRWDLTMAGPWGEVAMRKTFTAVEPGRRIVVRHEQEGHSFLLEMVLDAVPGGTRLTWRTTFATAAQLEAVRSAFVRGNEENLDRLHALLAGTRIL